MAISPPSDLVLDVVNAADPTQVTAAREKLRSVSAANEASVLTASNAGFASAINSIDTAAGKAGVGNIQHLKTDEKIPETYRKFEASVLSTMLQNMMPKDSEEVYGKGSAGDFWKSMMAEQMADAVSKRGGIGIAEQAYSQAMQKIRNAEAPTTKMNEDDKSLAVSMVTDFQRRTFSVAESNKTES
ncbi:rod-binding protein [Agrobacterium rubi]|uniref:Rod-binding protein n=1 Tax=Agrobacterium rubi TaxID=28099 RepID=A0AAE7R417_9HYPH|nr:rod-binding protein [Agrobacterium rubi]NTE85418.1 rod-binding protein [Agrobacterium rubi]NTF01350.1 rod-binding protein [Agrobacterium rubi]NTF35593.1 rod-binding protein [Agrobacterium rubi]OCJ48479.1 rod-binding protein [Agrobacterium rubi]QTG00719.1 rod-binding protein [Agrobacterium rubi]